MVLSILLQILSAETSGHGCWSQHHGVMRPGHWSVTVPAHEEGGAWHGQWAWDDCSDKPLLQRYHATPYYNQLLCCELIFELHYRTKVIMLHRFTQILNDVKSNKHSVQSCDILIGSTLKRFELKMTWSILQNWVISLRLANIYEASCKIFFLGSENSLLFLGQWAWVFCELVFAHIC